MNDIHAFGPLVASEAQRRGFYQAERRVFLSDGDAKLRTLHKLHFPDFTAVTDFMHVVGYLYAAAMATTESLRAGWPMFLEHAQSCWQGRVDEVIAHLAGLVGSEVTVTLEIEARIPDGAPDHLVRTVTENSRTLKFTNHGFESE